MKTKKVFKKAKNRLKNTCLIKFVVPQAAFLVQIFFFNFNIFPFLAHCVVYEVSEPLGSNETRTCPAVLLNSSGRSLRGRRLAGLRLRRDGLRGGRTQAEEPLHRAEAVVLIFSAASNGEKGAFLFASTVSWLES